MFCSIVLIQRITTTKLRKIFFFLRGAWDGGLGGGRAAVGQQWGVVGVGVGGGGSVTIAAFKQCVAILVSMGIIGMTHTEVAAQLPPFQCKNYTYFYSVRIPDISANFEYPQHMF